tara:strand:- start:20343 stop:21386 length:1044 start_codon:yes stop_codon:yes gene_type:complete
MKKIIIVGNWSWDHCEKAFSDALEDLNFEVIPFKVNENSMHKILQLIPLNFFTKNLQSRLIKIAQDQNPDFIFFWNATHISHKTICNLKERGIKIISYSNDDPYINSNKPLAQKFIWKNFLKYICSSDFHFVYRPINIIESKEYTNSPIYLLPPYFIPHTFENIELDKDDIERFTCDIVFIGHYEDDIRAEYLESVYDLEMDIKLFGTGWNERAPKSFINKFGKTERLDQKNYFKCLKASKICLSFLSKYNRDVYTRRCFEITGSGNLLLCERNNYITSLFKEDKEAVFFSSKEEMLQKIKWLLSNPNTLEQIQKSGQRRAYLDGHDIKSRVAYFTNLITEKSYKSL